MVNEDANAKLIRELKEEIMRLREMLKAEGIEVQEGLHKFFAFSIMFSISARERIKSFQSKTSSSLLMVMCVFYLSRPRWESGL